ncbi:restriction endonuclease subunit S [Pseudaquabacterium rugosum]|uniref:Restriction endonuclease subunit S n=1 Tax=Pseudaquabacterium rugosum TaxID=2984194 RepID=A0ABU9B3W3_9BURK
MLPEGWHSSTLGEIARITSGGTPDRSEPSYWGGDVPWVTTGEIQFNTITDTAEKITAAGLKNSSAKLFPPGTLLMAMYGQGKTRGQVAKLGIEAATNQACAAIHLHDGCSPDFFFQLLTSQYTTIRELGNAGTQQNLSGGILKAVTVAVPPLDEQRRIASILAAWDDATVLTQSLLANRRVQWQALLAATLHLPPANPSAEGGADNGGYPASVQPGIPNLSATPEGWRRIPLMRHLTEVRRPAGLRAGETYRLITVKRSRGGVELRETLTGDEIKTPSQFYVREGDFLISKRQIVHGACGIVPAELDGAVVSNEYAVLNSDGQIDLKFLRYLSESRYFQQTCFHSSIGVHVEKMIFKTERWLKWPFNIPPLPEQRRIVGILDLARREVELLERQIQGLRQEKAALMADLLTGKRRVRLDREGVAA